MKPSRARSAPPSKKNKPKMPPKITMDMEVEIRLSNVWRRGRVVHIGLGGFFQIGYIALNPPVHCYRQEFGRTWRLPRTTKKAPVVNVRLHGAENLAPGDYTCRVSGVHATKKGIEVEAHVTKPAENVHRLEVKPPVWTTRTGQRIPLTAMSVRHLWNAINLLSRRMLELVGELNRRLDTPPETGADETGTTGPDEDPHWDPRDDFSPGAFGSD